MIDRYNTVFLTLAFVVPGFVFYEVLSWLIYQEDVSDSKSLLRYLTLSCMNAAFWSWLIYLANNSTFFKGNALRTSLAWFLITFVSPTGFAYLFAHLRRNDRGRRWLIVLGFRMLNPEPTAWEARFSEIGQAWVRVTLTDGRVIGGLFASTSHASSHPSRHDIFLERQYKILDDEHWEPVPRSRGVWIGADTIEYIEFLGNEEMQNGKDQQERPKATASS